MKVGKKLRPMTIKRLRCPLCEFVRDIPRQKGKDRVGGHVKHMWCPRCVCERGFVEDAV